MQRSKTNGSRALAVAFLLATSYGPLGSAALAGAAFAGAALAAPQDDRGRSGSFDDAFGTDENDERVSQLEAAYLGLYHCLDGKDFEIKPRQGKSVADQLEARYGVGLAVMLREKAVLLDAKLVATSNAVRAWLPSARDGALRTALLGEETAIDELRTEALALIEIYEKKDQNKVDANRKRVESAYARYAKLVEAEFAFRDDVGPEEADALLDLLVRGEATLDAVDDVLASRGEDELERSGPPDESEPFSERGTWFAVESGYLEDVPWLLLSWAADRPIGVLRRIEAITDRIDIHPTAYERWLLRELRARAVDAFNARCVHTGSPNDADFTPIINGYRRGLGLELMTVDERLLMAARKHSQDQVDNDYFEHESPDPRRRTPWHRTRIEDYDGGAAENLAQGRGGYRAADVFEGWYRSPGHHRNMVGRHREFGAATDRAQGLWTLVLGRGDTRWREWHPELAPARRAELAKDASKIAKTLAKNGVKDRAWTKEIAPILPEIVDVLAAAALHTGALAEDGSRRDAIGAHTRFLATPIGARTLECALVSQVLEIAVESEDTAVRREADRFLRAFVPGLGAELDAVADKSGNWKAVRIAWEDRERVQFKAARSTS